MKKTTIYINGKFLVTQLSGVQRVAYELVIGLDTLLLEHEEIRATTDFILLYSGEIINPIKLGIIQLKKKGLLKGSAWEQIELPLYTAKGMLLSLCSIGPVLKSNQLLMVHDASFFVNKHFFSKLFGMWYRAAIPWLGKICKKVLTVSEFSRTELIEHAKISPQKIDVIYNSAEHVQRFAAPDDHFKDKINSLKPYCLAVSNLGANKNFFGLSEAIDKIDFAPYKMLIAGGGLSTLSKERKADNAIYLGYVSDCELRYLYENASLFIFPSFYEGFGIPPLEAMLLNCPVVTSNTSAMPEVCDNAASFFDPFNPEDMANKISFLLASPDELERLRTLGRLRAKTFTWRESSEKLLALLMKSA